jgi:flagellin FlaB
MVILLQVKIITAGIEYDNVYTYGALFVGTYANATEAWEVAMDKGWLCGPPPVAISCNPYNGTNNPTRTIAIFYWNVNQNDNAIMDIGEHAQLSVAYARDDRPESLDNVAFEISTPKGAPLTVDRLVPNITTKIVDLG